MSGEVLTQDLRRNSVTWNIFHRRAFENPRAIKLAELNTTNPALRLDITCALDEQNTSFTLGSSDLDERLSFCDGTGKARPTGIEPTAALAFYRDEDRNANGLFKKTFDWLRHEDFPFYLVQRVGPQDSGPTGTLPGELAKPFEVTDLIRVGLFMTDFPQDTVANDDPAMMTINPLPAGFLAWNRNPVA